MGEIHNGRYEVDEALAAVRRGLAELGRPLPTNPVLLVISTIGLFVAGAAGQMAAAGLRHRNRRATGALPA